MLKPVALKISNSLKERTVITKANYKELYPNGLTWYAVIGVCTAQKIRPRFNAIGQYDFEPEDILDVMERRKAGARHLKNYEQFAAKWDYMIERSKELIDGR